MQGEDGGRPLSRSKTNLNNIPRCGSWGREFSVAAARCFHFEERRETTTYESTMDMFGGDGCFISEAIRLSVFLRFLLGGTSASVVPMLNLVRDVAPLIPEIIRLTWCFSSSYVLMISEICAWMVPSRMDGAMHGQS